MKISDDVLTVLKSATTDGNGLKLTGQLDRGLYAATNKVLVACGGKWNRKAQAHVFNGDAGDALDQLITTGEYTNRKVDLQQFYTPEALALQVVQAARIEPGMLTLEPSAGPGALAQKARAAGATVCCVDIDQKNVNTLEAAGFSAVCKDFLSMSPSDYGGDLFDRVIMNPPFANRADIRHVVHAHRFLRAGGRLVSIMSAGVSFRTDTLTREFTEFVVANRGGFVELAEGAFRQSGTMVRTVMAVLEA